jgi:hypothetical protein
MIFGGIFLDQMQAGERCVESRKKKFVLKFESIDSQASLKHYL